MNGPGGQLGPLEGKSVNQAASIEISGSEAGRGEGKRRDAFVCAVCRNPMQPRAKRRGSPREYCSDACRRTAWERANPARRQKLLDFAPAPLPPIADQRVPRKERRRLQGMALAVIAMLREKGMVTNREFAEAFPPGAAWRSRVSDARLWLAHHGETIQSHTQPGGLCMYWLEDIK